MIEAKYEPQARVAADALRAALIAVENCGADPMLTDMVTALDTIRRDVCKAWALNVVQAHQAPGPGRVWSREHRAYIVGPEADELLARATATCKHGLHFGGHYCDDCEDERRAGADQHE